MFDDYYEHEEWVERVERFADPGGGVGSARGRPRQPAEPAVPVLRRRGRPDAQGRRLGLPV